MINLELDPYITKVKGCINPKILIELIEKRSPLEGNKMKLEGIAYHH